MSGLEARPGAQGLERGTPTLESIGPITFSPEGVLFIADNARGAIVAVDLGDVEPGDAQSAVEVEELDARLAAMLGCSPQDVHIQDLAVHPVSQEPFLSVMRGAGREAVPVVVRIDAGGAPDVVSLVDVPCAETTLDDAPDVDDERVEIRVAERGAPADEEMEIQGVRLRLARDSLRTATVTDMAYVDGALLVAGASNEEFTSRLRRVAFPFDDAADASSLEIFHVSHGKYETHSPIRAFVPYDGGAGILASYTCTPVVQFSLSDLGADKAQGRTVAELGAMNTPLDMVSFERDGEEFLLVSNSRHPLIRIARRDIDAQEPLTTPQAPAGVPREELAPEGVSKMARRDGHVLMLQRDAGGALHLRSYAPASL